MPQHILVAGAGKSSASLIHYLIQNAAARDWHITVADASEAAAAQKTGGQPAATALGLDINNAHERAAAVQSADIVLSLMPPALHVLLAEDCLRQRKHLITSSYVSPQMQGMDAAFKEAGIMAMCEMGLDPGIDHMTAMQILDGIYARGGELVSFKSYCGGLVAPESDDNPWHYKFTWNPRNIITAGADGAQYLEGGREVMVGYKDMFKAREGVQVAGLGELAYYPNRDSLHYIQLYKVPAVADFMRATLRYPAFIRGWNVLLQLGLTDTTVQQDVSGLTAGDWLQRHIRSTAQAHLFGDHADLLKAIGLTESQPLPVTHGTAGDILLALLLEKWAMQPQDKDMVVMQHEVIYKEAGEQKLLKSALIVIGDDSEETAMAKTVGLPMAMLAEGILDGTIAPQPGVHIPVSAAIYEPVLKGLERLGIKFKDEEVVL